MIKVDIYAKESKRPLTDPKLSEDVKLSIEKRPNYCGSKNAIFQIIEKKDRF